MFQEWNTTSILRNNTYEDCLLIVYYRIILTIDLDVSKALSNIPDRQCVYVQNDFFSHQYNMIKGLKTMILYQS